MPAWSVPAGLFLLALGVRLVVIPLIGFSPNEGSAYYVAVAANLASGHGLVSDAVWSYATPPQVVPKPAFELWLPMATLISAVPMTIVGQTLAAAQLGMAVLGAAIAPLAWLVGRDAGSASGLEGRRVQGVAITSGLLAAVLGPFVTAVAGPDSTTPFLVFGTLAAALMPRALTSDGRRWPGIVLGVALGLAYLSRQEAIWLGMAYLVLLGAHLRSTQAGRVLRAGVSALVPVVIGGLVVVVPWLVRNVIDLGSPLPGQAIENLWLRRNEDIFAWLDRPSPSAYLAQGVGTIVSDRVDALRHQLVSVVVLPPFPIGLLGMAAVVALRRSPALRHTTALTALLLSGALTFVATALLFPIATRWGTFLHSAGPLLVGLIVATALAGDALLARMSTRRGWTQVNVIIAPIALLAVTVPLLGLQLLTLVGQTERAGARVSAIARDLTEGLPRAAGERPVLITDHPMWLAAATGWRAIALPDEPMPAVADLARTFGAEWLVIIDERGRYPAELSAAGLEECIERWSGPTDAEEDGAWIVRLTPDCPAP